MNNKSDSVTNEVEAALEKFQPCTAKELLSGMSFEDIRSTLKQAQEANASKRSQGAQLPGLGVSEGEDSIRIYNPVRPYQDELTVTREQSTGKVTIMTADKCKQPGD